MKQIVLAVKNGVENSDGNLSRNSELVQLVMNLFDVRRLEIWPVIGQKSDCMNNFSLGRFFLPAADEVKYIYVELVGG